MIAPRANPPPRGAIMKPFFRLVLSAALAVLFGATAFAAVAPAPAIGPSGITALPGSGAPGDNISLSITVTNAAGPTTAPTNLNDFVSGGTATAQVTFTHLVTGSSFVRAFTVTAAAAVAENGGTGPLTGTFQIPTQTTQAGSYRATVVLSAPSVGTITNSSFSVSTVVLTVTGKPDLAITSLTYAAGTAYNGGERIPMSLTYTNRVASNGVTNVPYVASLNGDAAFFRIEVILSSNPTFGDADDFLLTSHDISATIDADGVDRPLSWNQVLPGNFAGSYYVMAKIDTLSGVSESIDNDLSRNGNNTWFSPDTNGTRISLRETNFPTVYWASIGSNRYSDNPSVSPDGRYTVFASDATTLGTSDTNGVRDIFLYDNNNSTSTIIRRINVSQQGAQANAASNNPAISAVGSGNVAYVAFSSDATNLVLNDTNGFSDIFVVNTVTSLISRVSVPNSADQSTLGVQANGSSFKPAISSTGRFVVFESNATNLVAGGTAVGVTHIYRVDRDVNNSGIFDTPGNTKLVLVSQSTGGAAGNGNSIQATISGGGQYVAFASDATNLGGTVLAGRRNIYLHDITGATTTLVSTAAGGADGSSRAPSINQNTGNASDGRYIAYGSEATNLVVGDTNAVSDIFVYDRVATTTSRVSVSSAGVQASDPSAVGFRLGSINPGISSTGRYVAFASLADNLTDGSANGQYSASDSNRALDIFVIDRDVSGGGTFDTGGNIATTMVSRNRFGYQTQGLLGSPSTAASDIYPAISADGRFVSFPSDAENTGGLVHGATNRTSPDTNSYRDIFLHDRRINSLPGSSPLPVGTITKPGNNSFAQVNTPIQIEASATTTTGNVVKVEFFVNNTSLGSDFVYPYTQTWTPTAVGVYRLSVLVTDDNGNEGGSTNVFVTINAPPSVGLTKPVGGSSITVGTVVPVSATAGASNPGGTVTSVEFFVNDLPHAKINAPASFDTTWTPTVAGVYTLKAVATETIGSQTTQGTSSLVSVTVVTAGGGSTATPPIVSLNPTPPTTSSVNARVTLSANAAAGSAATTISNVQFFANGSLVGSASAPPYTFVWVPQALGTYSITAVATDNLGASTTSTAASVTVSGVLAVSLSSPLANASVQVNTPQVVAATASMSNGTVVRVEFFANGTSIGTATSFPYTITWTPTTPGTYSLSATATDNTGAQAVSVPNVISVGTGTAPNVSIVSPLAGVTVAAGNIQTIVANATALSGTIASVQFFANGVSIGTDTSFPYNQAWSPTGVGVVELTAVAMDSIGNRTTSAPIVVSVAGLSASAPVVSIASPQGGASLPVGVATTIAASATDADGTIAGVEFFANGVSLGVDNSYPYSIPFVPAATGNYSLTARATDNGGNMADSAPVVVSVSGGTAPAVAIVGPASGSVLNVNTPQTILVNATSPSGFITGVQFLINGTTLATGTSFPYSTAWTPGAIGTYSLVARAADNLGNVTESSPVLVTVIAGSPSLPTVALTSTPNGTNVTVNSPVFVSANANDPDGLVSNVEFFVNNQPIGSKSAAPYFVTWVPTTTGAYNIKAVATDDAGNRVTSSSSALTVVAQSGALPSTGLTFNDPSVDTPTGATPPTTALTPVKVDFGSKLIIRAAAVKDDGTITNVQFYANGTNIGSLTAPPFFTTYQLNTLSDVVLTALVTDSSGNTVYTNPILVDTQPATGAAGALVTLVSPLDGSTYVTGGQIIFSATHNFGNVVPPKIDFYVNGSQFTTVSTATGTGASAPYQFVVGMTRAGTYIIHAVGRSSTTTTVSAPVRIVVTSSQAPNITLTSPAAGTPYTVGTSLTIAANAVSGTGLISSVQFFVNGAALSTKTTSPYTAAWNPGAAGKYTLTALATDDSGNQTLSAPLAITLASNLPPTVSITSPSSGTTVGGGTIVNLTAAAADADGKVESVRFLSNGNLVGTASAAPFSTSWTPTAAGSYSVIAQATDNSGNVTNSAPIAINVTGNQGPVVALASPSNGSVVRVGSGATLTATASDADGTIASVQFFANGVSVGSAVTTLPYRAQWTPTAEGIYRLTSVAVDNAGAVTTSSALTVLAVSSASGGSDTIYTGDYSGSGEIGRFAVITVRGKTAAFIGYSTTAVAKTYYFPGLSVDGGGNFSATDSLGRVLLSANANDTGVSGSLDAGRVFVIGINAGLFPAARAVAAGYYAGNITGRPASTLAAIVGADGSITVYAADGTFQTAGAGSVDASGNFTVNTSAGVRFTGKADPATGFITGTLSGANGGTFTAATSSGVSFSDGFLRNLSTRGQVGTGSNILIAGFVVGGTVPKQVLIRAIGPTLSGFGLTGALTDPQLQVFNSSSALVVANNNWGGAGDVISASAQVGAFPLAANSLDAVVLASLAPGAYTAQVSGAGGGTGIALVELYDVDTLSPFSTQKVMNVATRGVVGTEQGQLIAGFVVSGNTAKKVLVRAVGPTLAAAPFNVAGVLADPALRIVRSDNVVVRENDNWEAGNDAALVAEASVRVGAFPLAAGSKDAAILINLPPGTYNAQATGSGTTTGVALIEVYEVP